MRSLLTIALLSVLALTVSCSSTAVNDFKITASNKAQTAVTSELELLYTNVSVPGVDCTAEAVAIGTDVHDKVFNLLKAKETLVQANMVAAPALTAAGTVVYEVCNYLVASVIPGYIKSVDAKYACLRSLSANAISKASGDLCSVINF